VVVVTHRPPPDAAATRFPRTTFTGSVEEAVGTAKGGRPGVWCRRVRVHH
jgi:hypothetical protein